MKKALALTFVTFAIAALVASTLAIGTAQTANAQGKSDDSYGKKTIRGNAQTGDWGDAVSDAARDGSGHGIGDFRADGCKQGQDSHGNSDVC